MKRGTYRFITIFLVLIFLFAIPASAGLLTDVANRFSFGSMSMMTGFGIFDFFEFTGRPVDSSAHVTGDSSCQTNEDCFGKAFIGSTSTADRCQTIDEYADEQFYDNRLDTDSSDTQCACQNSLCYPRTLSNDITLLTPGALRSCASDSDCQGMKEKCVGVVGNTAKFCKEVDCTQASDCQGKYPRVSWSSGEIERNQACNQNAEFPIKCYCSKSNWCATRDGTEQCANNDGCGIGESCTNGKCVESLVLNAQLRPLTLVAVPVTAGALPTRTVTVPAGTATLPTGDNAADARALYDQLMAKLENLEGRVEVLKTENQITGAFSASDLTDSGLLSNIGSVAQATIPAAPAADTSTGFTQDQLANSSVVETMGVLAETPIPQHTAESTTRWYKTIAIPAIDERMITLESELCALVQLVDGIDYGDLVLYDGEELCSDLVEEASPFVIPDAGPTLWDRFKLNVPFFRGQAQLDNDRIESMVPREEVVIVNPLDPVTNPAESVTDTTQTQQASAIAVSPVALQQIAIPQLGGI